MTQGITERRSIRAKWRGWRRSRPFWAGLLTIISGVILTLIPLGGVRFTFIQGSIIWAALLVGLLVLFCGFTLWAGGQYHFFVGGLIIIFSLVAIVTSDLGGFLVGSLLGLIGGAMALAWIPGKPPEASPLGPQPVRDPVPDMDYVEPTIVRTSEPHPPSEPTPSPAIDALTVQELIPSLWERIVSDLRPERGQPTLPQPS